MPKFEVPLILEVEADTREEALSKASDVADGVTEVFEAFATAVTTDDHNLLERLRIKVEGTPS